MKHLFTALVAVVAMAFAAPVIAAPAGSTSDTSAAPASQGLNNMAPAAGNHMADNAMDNAMSSDKTADASKDTAKGKKAHKAKGDHKGKGKHHKKSSSSDASSVPDAAK